MMRAIATGFLVVAMMVGFAVPPVRAASTDADVARLSAQLERLSADPVLGQYALAQRTLARNAIADLQNAGRSGRDHALFMAEQRVALVQAAAQRDADEAKIDQLQRERDQIMLDASQADAAAARAELARQRLQYEAAVQQAQMMQEQGAQATQQAQAEAQQAQKLAAAQARAAALARKEAQLAEAATHALQGGSSGSAGGGQPNSLALSSVSFESGSDSLTAAGRRRVADFARAHANQRVVVEPRGSSDSRVLAGRRAVAVEAALAAAGAGQVSIQAVGRATRGVEIDIRAQ